MQKVVQVGNQEVHTKGGYNARDIKRRRVRETSAHYADKQ